MPTLENQDDKSMRDLYERVSTDQQELLDEWGNPIKWAGRQIKNVGRTGVQALHSTGQLAGKAIDTAAGVVGGAADIAKNVATDPGGTLKSVGQGVAAIPKAVASAAGSVDGDDAGNFLKNVGAAALKYPGKKLGQIATGVKNTGDALAGTIDQIAKGGDIINPSAIANVTGTDTYDGSKEKSIAGQALDAAGDAADTYGTAVNALNPTKAALDIGTDALADTVTNSLTKPKTEESEEDLDKDMKKPTFKEFYNKQIQEQGGRKYSDVRKRQAQRSRDSMNTAIDNFKDTGREIAGKASKFTDRHIPGVKGAMNTAIDTFKDTGREIAGKASRFADRQIPKIKKYIDREFSTPEPISTTLHRTPKSQPRPDVFTSPSRPDPSDMSMKPRRPSPGKKINPSEPNDSSIPKPHTSLSKVFSQPIKGSKAPTEITKPHKSKPTKSLSDFFSNPPK